jgi:putative tricarboxylic transport membrane protein
MSDGQQPNRRRFHLGFFLEFLGREKSNRTLPSKQPSDKSPSLQHAALDVPLQEGGGSVPAGKFFARGVIRNPQDFYGGLVLIAIALFALLISRNLSGMHGFTFGPGTAPRLFAVLLAVTGAAVVISSLMTIGPPLERYGLRGPLFITASILVFALTVRPLGLVIASFASIVIAAAASPEVRWLESLIWAVVLTFFCALLFPYGLNLPLQLWPSY